MKRVLNLPKFGVIVNNIETIEAELDALLADCEATLQSILARTSMHTWQSLVAPLEEIQDRVHRFWNPINNLSNVSGDTPGLKEVYDACNAKVTAFSGELGRNGAYYQALKHFSTSHAYAELTPVQKQVVKRLLHNFEVAGVALSDEKKKQLATVEQELARLGTLFRNNVTDATNKGWFLHITDEADLRGISPEIVRQALEIAEAKGLPGWVFTLDSHMYLAVVEFCDKREHREAMYRGFATRASEQGPDAGKWDNSPAIEAILKLRIEQAKLLGFSTPAEHSLAYDKSAGSMEEVSAFLDNLVQSVRPKAKKEYAAIVEFACANGVSDPKPWDLGYFTEKLKREKFGFDSEALRPYFPVQTVRQGLFTLANRLFGIEFKKRDGVDTWHKDVVFCEMWKDGELSGGIYMDLFAREGKRGGAWMGLAIKRRVLGDETLELPVAYLNCNFPPEFLNHTEVRTIFHEFGHCLHHLLGRIDYPVIAMDGVAWDVIEVPSTFMENFSWTKEVLDLVSGHTETGEKIPAELFEKMLAVKNFDTGLFFLRRLVSSLFDFRLHMSYQGGGVTSVYEFLNEVRKEISVVSPPDWNRLPNSFMHIFCPLAGAYVAGYYSYLWAYVLSADIFSAFKEAGIMNRETGERYVDSILAPGASRDFSELFLEFRGRNPSQEALLRQNGFLETT